MPRRKQIDPSRRYLSLLNFLTTDVTKDHYLKLAFAALGRRPAQFRNDAIGVSPSFNLETIKKTQKELKGQLDEFVRSGQLPSLTLEDALDLRLRALFKLCKRRGRTRPHKEIAGAVTVPDPKIMRLQRCKYCGRYYGRRPLQPKVTCGRKACIRQHDKERRCRRSTPPPLTKMYPPGTLRS